MRLFKHVTYKLSKNETPSILMDRINYVLFELNYKDITCKLYLVDLYSTRSYTQRAIKKFPALQRFYSNTNFDNTITNLDSYWGVNNPYPQFESIPFDVMEGIAKGIPKVLPFDRALLIFDNIDWFGNGVNYSKPVIHKKRPTPETPYDYLSSSIIIQSEWDAHGRDNWIYVTLELTTPDFNQTILPMDPKVQKLLESLGTIQKQDYEATLTQDELFMNHSLIMEGKSVWNKYNDNIYELVMNNVPECDFKEVVLSHEEYMKILKESIRNIIQSHDFSNIHNETKKTPISPKKVITRLFSKNGFSYLEIPGFVALGKHVLIKKTSHNNQLEVNFEYWSRGGEISCRLTYKVPYLNHIIDLPITKDKEICTRYTIDNENALKKVVTNCLYIIEYLEDTLIQELDNIYGYAPVWYDY